MKRVALAIVSTVTALVLLLSFKSHATTAVATGPAAASTSTSGSSSSTTPGTGSSSKAKKRSTATAKKTASASTAAKTYTGSAINTRYGPVQVQIKVKNGKITTATAVEYPDGEPRDAQINAYAVPALNTEATQANSANIDSVSGASYTSAGYIASLQSAIDQAGL